MDFIERWLGFSPDGGNGAFEFLAITCLVLAALAVAYRRSWLAVARRWVAARGNGSHRSG